KLRDSCEACAASKVKCNKEKPTCARCTRRKIQCEYVVTKRAGRKHDSRKTTSTQTGSTTSDAGILRIPNKTPPSLGQETASYAADISPSVFSPGDSTSWWTPDPEFDDFFASPVSFSPPESFDSDTTSLFFSRSGTNSTKGGYDLYDTMPITPENAFVSMENVSRSTDLSRQLSRPESQSSLPSEALSFQDCRSEPAACCLVCAIALLKQKFGNSATPCTCSKRQGFGHDSCQFPTIQTVITGNKESIETISNILQCPCSQDGYLLAILSLVVFKILGWYAAAARETRKTPGWEESQSSERDQPEPRRPSSCHSEQVFQFPAILDNYSPGSEDQGCIAAQLVLGELHHVQRLVAQLSSRLKVVGSQSVHEDNITSPFSAAVLDQLAADLRKRLRTLSLEIVDTLR
ncbi:hypothetical protein OIDMADRAFT_76913, partial [Oidiodendron maius Zn]